MTSRLPAKARTIPAEPDQYGALAEPDGDDPAAVAPRRRTLFCSAAVFIAMTALEFFYFRQLSGGLPSLDMRFAGFTPDEGMAWLTALGRRGGEIILVWHYLTFDLLFPALLSLTLVSLILATGRRLKNFRAMPAQIQSIFALVAGAALHACRLCPEHRGGAPSVRFPVGQSGFAVFRLGADRHQIRASGDTR